MIYLTKPYYKKGGVIAGQTRLHTLMACWEDYDESAIKALIHRRETGKR
jgi:hypothetical protein